MIRSSIVYGIIMMICILYFPLQGHTQEDVEILQLLSPQKEEKESRVDILREDTRPQEEVSRNQEQEKIVLSRDSEKDMRIIDNLCTKNLLDEYRNTSVWQFYLGIRGGGAITGSYGNLTAQDKKYVGVGIHPVFGGSIGLGIQTTPNFTFRIGLGVEHLFKSSRFIASINTSGNGSNLIENAKQTTEKTHVLGEVYFDFHSGLWSSFFFKIAGGYSWVKVDGKSESGATAGMGLGVRWYAHKYVTFDWTILDVKATFTKSISGDVGSQVGITFQY